MKISVQRDDFDVSSEISQMCQERHDVGAVANFLGIVREHPLTLEHYPGMTEQVIERIVFEAVEQFGLIDACVIHRIGLLNPGEQIVLVLALAQHRQAALRSVSFIMDHLKTKAPFWKEENGTWTKQRDSDIQAVQSWNA